MEEIKRPNIKNLGFQRAFRELMQTLLIIAGLYTFMNLAMPQYMVEGSSMQPNFRGDGTERVFISRLDYMLSDPARGEIVVLRNPDDPDGKLLIKRIIGLPGEHVQMNDGYIYINGKALTEPYIQEHCNKSTCDDREWFLEADQYLVLGDNRNNSLDSTRFGPVDRSLIVGHAVIQVWPPDEWQIFQHPDYE